MAAKMGADFRQLFSEQFGCEEKEFEQRIFNECLFRHSVPVVALLRRCRPELFREDLDLARELAATRDTGEVVSELNRFYGRNARERSFLRTRLYCRISGKRVLKLYRSLIRAAEEGAAERGVPKAA